MDVLDAKKVSHKLFAEHASEVQISAHLDLFFFICSVLGT